MTRQNQKPGPAALLWSILFSNLLLAVGFGYPSIAFYSGAHEAHAGFQQKLPSVMMILVGMVSSLAAESRLSRGLMEEEWTERQLTPVRSLLRSSAVSMFGWALIAGALLAQVVIHIPRPNGIMWSFFPLLFALNRVRIMFKPEDTAPVRSVPSSLADARPLHSEHWGT